MCVSHIRSSRPLEGARRCSGAERRCDGGQPRNFIRPCLLLLLKESPSYGYELLERLPPFGLSRDHASLYRTLRALESEGLVHSGWEARGKGPARRRYEVTVEGEAWLDAWAGAIDDTRSLLGFYLNRYNRVQSKRASRADLESAGAVDPRIPSAGISLD
jgi:PadR family transcriptional regulator PadR